MGIVVLLLVNAVAVANAQDNASGSAAFNRMKALVGDWEGSLEWTGARTGSGPAGATYSLTGHGSALVESLVIEGVPSMTSVYHLDGADLRMTHYCAAQNQPRLKAQRIDLEHGALDFAFVDATNLRSPDAPHVDGVEIQFVDSDHFTLSFRFQGGGNRSVERITLRRVAAKAS
jgi:hypothetical protein